MSAVRLSLKDARTIRDWFATDPGEGCPSSVTEAMGRLKAALQSSPKKTAAKKAKAATVRAKRKTHRAETSEIYREVEARAGGACECGCGLTFDRTLFGQPNLDHFWGRARVRQAITNVWLIRSDCHDLKHAAKPSRANWLRRWAGFAERNGYRSEAAKAEREIEAEELVSQAAALTGGGR